MLNLDLATFGVIVHVWEGIYYPVGPPTLRASRDLVMNFEFLKPHGPISNNGGSLQRGQSLPEKSDQCELKQTPIN